MSELKRGREKFDRYKNLINLLIKVVSVFPINFRKKAFEQFRFTKGIVGIGIRYILLKSIAKKCGENILIHPGVYIFSPEKLILGNNISVHPMSYIDATGGIIIGNDVSIAHGVTILSTSHAYEDLDIPIRDQKVLIGKTVVKNDVWIGAKATILYRVVVDNGSIIGANSLVNKSVSMNSIVGGNPSKLIKSRKSS